MLETQLQIRSICFCFSQFDLRLPQSSSNGKAGSMEESLLAALNRICQAGSDFILKALAREAIVLQRSQTGQLKLMLHELRSWTV